MNKRIIKHFLMKIFCIVVIFLLLSPLAQADVFFDMDTYTDANSSAVITLIDPNANTDPNSIEEVTLQVESTSDPNGITILAEETDPNTDKFTADFGFTRNNSDDENKLIQVSDGDTITVTYDESDWTDTAEIDFADLDEPEEPTDNNDDPNAPEGSTNNDETHSTSDSPDFTFGKHKGCFINTAAAGLKVFFH